MSKELNKLKISRKSLKASLTRFETYLNTQIDSPVPDLAVLENRLTSTLTLYDKFEDVQLQIECLTQPIDDQDPDIDVDSRQDFETSFFEITMKAKKFLTVQMQTITTTSPTNSDNAQNSRNTFSHVKLPDIRLPTFDGAYKNWLFFKETFLSVVDSNTSMPKAQKLNYLRLSLKGEPFNLIESLQICDANYDIAWSCLSEKYENIEKLLGNHVKELFNLPLIHKETYSSLCQLLDNTNRNLKALKALGEPVEHWDTLLVHLLTTKLNESCRNAWEAKKPKREKPNLKKFLEFLEDRTDTFESIENNKPNTSFPSNSNPQKIKTTRTLAASNIVTNSYTPKCVFCNEDHIIYNCNKFLQLETNSRYNEIKRLKLCINCLRKNHTLKDCTASKCRKCNSMHNTLLHFDSNSRVNVASRNAHPESNASANVCRSESDSIPENAPECSTSDVAAFTQKTHCSVFPRTCTLLSTAVVNISNVSGDIYPCRILLDSGSQCNLITTSFCRKLNLNTKKIQVSISGINESSSKIHSRVNVNLQSRLNSFTVNLNCLVIDVITGLIPCTTFDKKSLNVPPNIILADPSFDISSPIDMLVGADIFWDLLCVGQFKLGHNAPYLQKTHFGWIVSGPLALDNKFSPTPSCNLNILNNSDLHQQLEKFWQLDTIADKKHLSQEEIFCEQHFQSNTFRDPTGRFVVAIPFKTDAAALGDSFQMAKRRFHSLEKKMLRDESLKTQYSSFIDEYIQLGHMTKITNNEDCDGFYLPHHPVFKPSSTTTKIRVVFDGSAKSTSNYSVNNLMMVGPTIQNDLFSIALRFRKHRIVIAADIAKMYRQILVIDRQRKFQRILWRSNPSDPLDTYELNTVTYGLASSAFLSTRCLHQIGDDIKSSNPKLSFIIQNDFYVDDLLSGGETLDDVLDIKKQLTELFSCYGMDLRKWNSNSSAVLSDVDSTDSIEIGCSESSKALGLNWHPTSDTLTYSSLSTPIKTTFTKRSILSGISQLFDPLGLLSPTIITAKLLIQELWQIRASWDESVPMSIQTKWVCFQNDLTKIPNVTIPRFAVCFEPIHIELVGFADASESAYGCAIYLKSLDLSGNYHCHLLCAKSRVAPLKVISIPRLELCAALLLAQHMSKVKDSLHLDIAKLTYFSDSTIVLSWIRTSPHLLKTFVANRISCIQSLTNSSDWFHVDTHENPADLLTRGISVSTLIDSRLWWRGPTFLASNDNPEESFKPMPIETLPEQKPRVLISTFNSVTDFLELSYLNKYSSFKRLQRVFAYVLRFARSCRPNTVRQFGPLLPNELNDALYQLVRIVQQESFPLEIKSLMCKGTIDPKSNLISLNPFIDDHNLLRVGGRLKNSNFSFDKKFPAILPRNHRFTKLYMEYQHLELLHAGPTLLLATMREQFWPIGGRKLAKDIIHNCMRCFRFNAQTSRYLMSHLPFDRIQPSRPFSVCGTDYAGPFQIKDRNTRNYKLLKAYVCIFVCFSTKAVHLELVSSLATDSFLACLKRFMSRRGLCKKIFSDHGTNFQGAQNELKKFFKLNSNSIKTSLSDEGIEWMFIPPNSPHFGGLWEAGVKSIKYHLKRTIGDARLTFEEYTTLLCQIESCLNSRPICPLSDDPTDPVPLTPAHFLIGSSLKCVPEDDLTHLPENRLKTFQLIQQKFQTFWKRWSKEYISQLQPRKKWQVPTDCALRPGSLVLIKEDGLPPLKWCVGRVLEVIPGSDGIIRSAKVKTASSVLHRPAVKLSILPCS